MKLPALRRPSWSALTVALVLVALLGVTAQRGLAWRDEHQTTRAGEAAAAAARAEVERLITISDTGSEATLEKLLDGATADFRAELERRATQLRKALADSKVTATGDIVSSGVVKLDDERATVIVAAEGTVRNATSDADQPRSYRLSVDLQRVDDAWLVSGLEFVA